MRIKHDLSFHDSNIDDEVRPHLVHVLSERITLLEEALEIKFDVERSLPKMKLMRKILRNDLYHFEYALENHVLKS